MDWWIEQNQVVAIAPPGEPPANITVVDGVDAASIDLVFFDGTTVQFRPEQPSPLHYWDPGLSEWVSPPLEQQPPVDVWPALEARLRNTPFWGHLWEQMGLTTRANACVTFLLTAITSTHNFDDLTFGWNQLRAAMQAQSSLTDFSQEQLDFVAGVLADLGVSLPGLNMDPPA